ncbi:magnesium-transporting ATPase [Companilactobacillus sp. RD055328]|uniref:HAD-IC family P-type ATPase n=1 Tax=Companilactobacillus sp. RD055328 TaxID=2916634 RepID=UPI001FC8CE5C|nr:HAD-IC family P-type ATPase [Companilactobacillus sp. RD055328]GKQ43246.1 magnesium-transporting ATPase [Companilactobacillus sp. RD055328]
MLWTDLDHGLTDNDVTERVKNKQTNITIDDLTRTTYQIIFDNLFTIFNIVNMAIAILISITGSFNNLFFLGPVIVNLIFGTYQELKSKRALDRISLVNEHEISTLRNGLFVNVKKEDLVLDDLIKLSRGDQIPADGIVRQTDRLEVNESSLTGESNSIEKKPNDKVLSGSFIVSGNALIQLTAVGANSFISKMSLEVRQEKHKISFLMKTINTIIKVLTYTLIPLGLALFFSSYLQDHSYNKAILGTSGLVIGMIPQGLVLLATVALSVGALNLTRKKVLVRSLSSIETLARVDVLCLDKTGTITTGNLSITDIVAKNNSSKQELINIAKSIVIGTKETNQTATAITNYQSDYDLITYKTTIPFSSEKKSSGLIDESGNKYLMGALEFMLDDPNPNDIEAINNHAKSGKRVISITKNDTLLGYLLIVDEVRKEAKETFSYLSNQGITLKIISGDNPLTVSNVAQQANIKDAKHFIDLSKFPGDIDYNQLVTEYTVFGRVKPDQKKYLIMAMQEQGLTVGMTGDGVNDILAMKQADCSIAIAGGSDAAESTADFVLLNKNFDSMIFVLNEGRRVINNIERVASLYLLKTIYSVALTIIFIFMQTDLPFHPSQMTPVNMLTVGIPTSLLALQPDYRPPAGKFMRNVLEIALPAAINIVIWTMIITTIAHFTNMPHSNSSTLIVLLICSIEFATLYVVGRPINRLKIAIFVILYTLMALIFIFSGNIFNLVSPLNKSMIIYSAIIVIGSYPIFEITRELLGRRIFSRFAK